MQPYIGITGFTAAYEVLYLLRKVGDLLQGRKLMVGVLASEKTKSRLQNSRPNRYPRMHKIPPIFRSDERVLNLIHYHPENSNSLDQQLVAMTHFGGENLHGFQINKTWPPSEALRKYSDCYPYMQIVLQINRPALEAVGNSPASAAEKIAAEYYDLIDGILFDMSGGIGKLIDPDEAIPYLRQLRKELPNLGLGIAGGLSLNNLDCLKPIIEEIPDLSIDAESRLRTDSDTLALTDKAVPYIRSSVMLFEKNPESSKK